MNTPAWYDWFPEYTLPVMNSASGFSSEQVIRLIKSGSTSRLTELMHSVPPVHPVRKQVWWELWTDPYVSSDMLDVWRKHSDCETFLQVDLVKMMKSSDEGRSTPWAQRLNWVRGIAGEASAHQFALSWAQQTIENITQSTLSHYASLPVNISNVQLGFFSPLKRLFPAGPPGFPPVPVV